MAGSEVQPIGPSKWLAPCVAATLLTFLIWASSPLLYGVVEPWDTPYPFYSITAFLGGTVVGYSFRGTLLPAFVGAWLGQVVALLTLPGHDRAWFALGGSHDRDRQSRRPRRCRVGYAAARASGRLTRT